jgi:hypothetical protein
MDPFVNIQRQREIAAEIIALHDRLSSGFLDESLSSEEIANRLADQIEAEIRLGLLAEELAELVIALDEWRSKGGYDPYQPGANEPRSPEAR